MSKGAPKGPDYGILFPIDEKGTRSTGETGKKVIAQAIRAAMTEDSEKLADACANEKKWRWNYQKHFKNLVKVSARNPEAALNAARAGVEYMHANFEYLAPNSTEKPIPFRSFMKGFKSDPKQALNTYKIVGSKRGSAGKPIEVEYEGKMLKGDALKAQINKWAKYGTIESDAAESLCTTAEGNVDLAGKHYVLIGAGSAMGPLYKLLEHGATVVCLDISGTQFDGAHKCWERIIAAAKDSPGTIIFPLASHMQADYVKEVGQELYMNAGVDLIKYPAEILEWLSKIAPGQSLCVGNYTYLDSDLHVKLAIAADAIIEKLCETRKNTKVAFLCTPTDLHVVTDQAHKAASSNYGWHLGRGWELFFQIASFGKLLKKNALAPLKTDDADRTLKIVDGISTSQGPNYALAKRLQHWRAMIAYENNHVVSSNIAPSTATASVVSNRQFQWAYGGMPYFKPYEIFQQQTTNGIMGAMLIYDTTNSASVANPKNRSKFQIKNTLELFKWNSIHGGVWRAAYTVDSIGELSVLIHFMGGPKLFLFLLTFIGCLIAAGVLHFTGVSDISNVINFTNRHFVQRLL